MGKRGLGTCRRKTCRRRKKNASPIASNSSLTIERYGPSSPINTPTFLGLWRRRSSEVTDDKMEPVSGGFIAEQQGVWSRGVKGRRGKEEYRQGLEPGTTWPEFKGGEDPEGVFRRGGEGVRRGG
jgi:hypothetical protein